LEINKWELLKMMLRKIFESKKTLKLYKSSSLIKKNF